MTVDREDFLFVLKKLRDVRVWSVHTKTDPWAFRQALITIMEADTRAALGRGITRDKLEEFDTGARREILKFLGEEERTPDNQTFPFSASFLQDADDPADDRERRGFTVRSTRYVHSLDPTMAPIEEVFEWLTLTELQGRLSGSPTKHVLAVWDGGVKTEA